MAYDEKLAERIRTQLAGRRDVTGQKMFGGIAFMVSGNMCCGVMNGDLVARVSRDDYAAALKKPHTRPMDFTGRVLKGFILVAPEALRTSRGLKAWVDRSIAFVNTLPDKPDKPKPKKSRPTTRRE